jgi:hypothetical protein
MSRSRCSLVAGRWSLRKLAAYLRKVRGRARLVRVDVPPVQCEEAQG